MQSIQFRFFKSVQVSTYLIVVQQWYVNVCLYAKIEENDIIHIWNIVSTYYVYTLD